MICMQVYIVLYVRMIMFMTSCLCCMLGLCSLPDATNTCDRVRSSISIITCTWCQHWFDLDQKLSWWLLYVAQPAALESRVDRSLWNFWESMQAVKCILDYADYHQVWAACMVIWSWHTQVCLMNGCVAYRLAKCHSQVYLHCYVSTTGTDYKYKQLKHTNNHVLCPMYRLAGCLGMHPWHSWTAQNSLLPSFLILYATSPCLTDSYGSVWHRCWRQQWTTPQLRTLLQAGLVPSQHIDWTTCTRQHYISHATAVWNTRCMYTHMYI